MVAYARAGHVRPRDQLGMAAISAIAGAGGALLAHLVPAEVLRIVMPLILIAVAAFFALKPGLTDEARAARIPMPVFAGTVVPLVAAYDGFFGPGTGSFFMLGFVLLAGYGILKATAHTKALNFASNIGSLMVFIPTGALWWGGGPCHGGRAGGGRKPGRTACNAARRAPHQAASRHRLHRDGAAATVAGAWRLEPA